MATVGELAGLKKVHIPTAYHLRRYAWSDIILEGKEYVLSSSDLRDSTLDEKIQNRPRTEGRGSRRAS
jgi:hypothetical protein